MFSPLVKATLGTAIIATFLTGCATKTLITKDGKTYNRTTRVTLVEDNVVAFGQPAQAAPNLPRDSIVIAASALHHSWPGGNSGPLTTLALISTF